MLLCTVYTMCQRMKKLFELNVYASFSYSVAVGNKMKTAQSINKIIAGCKKKKEQSVIELLAVRSIPKAVYTTKNVGHYGLGFEYYTHFTSPYSSIIRMC